MAVLFDTDAFCKLGATGLLEAVAERLGSRLAECARLPALPHQLQRGGIRKRYGDVICEGLKPIASSLAAIPDPSVTTLELFRTIPNVDPGEARLLALCIERGDILVTGDKRALSAVAAAAPELAGRLAGKVVLLEAILLALCSINGEAHVRTSCAAAVGFDAMFAVCFSSGNLNVTESLRAYLDDSRRTCSPIDLWDGEE